MASALGTIGSVFLTNAVNGAIESIFTGPWGIFTADGGSLVLQPDTIAAMAPRREFRISNAPTENGGFRSYNRVAVPNEFRVRMVAGGYLIQRTAFLKALDKLIESTALYTITMPERSYRNVSITGYEMNRTREEGANLIDVAVTGSEVRLTSSSTVTTAKPDGATQVSNGPVQTAAAPANVDFGSLT